MSQPRLIPMTLEQYTRLLENALSAFAYSDWSEATYAAGWMGGAESQFKEALQQYIAEPVHVPGYLDWLQAPSDGSEAVVAGLFRLVMRKHFFGAADQGLTESHQP